MRHEIGVDRLMFGTDYPHPEGTWPNTQQWIRHAFAGVPEAEARAILGENTIRCYGLDRARLEAVARRIGPDPASLLATGDVDERLLTQFHHRAGYLRPKEHVDHEYTDRDDRRGPRRHRPLTRPSTGSITAAAVPGANRRHARCRRHVDQPSQARALLAPARTAKGTHLSCPRVGP